MTHGGGVSELSAGLAASAARVGGAVTVLDDQRVTDFIIEQQTAHAARWGSAGELSWNAPAAAPAG